VIARELPASHWANPGQYSLTLYNSIFDELAHIEFRYRILSIYMTETHICLGLNNLNRDTFVILNPTSLAIERKFGQTLDISAPFYIFESDFTNFINVGQFYHLYLTKKYLKI